jgi:L-seryl-tRNA(Ser) seleniumtransferase
MSIYEELFRLRPIINAAGTMTLLGGSLMAPETVAAMDRAAEEWVDMPDLLRLACEGIASSLGLGPRLGGVHITSGAAAANLLAAAAVMTGHDRARMDALPGSSGFPNEILMQPTHAGGWARSYAAAGARIAISRVETVFDKASGQRILGVTEQSFESGINEHTCAIGAILSWEVAHAGGLSIPELVTIARRHNLPVIVDAAAQIPPITTIKDLLEMGVDLVAVSGGKAISGPNDTGLLAGNQIYLTAAILQSSPNTRVVGRGLKVSKEQIVGLYVALKAYVESDADARLAQEQRRCDFLMERLGGIEHVRLEKLFPDETDLPVPRVRVHLLEALGKTVDEITHTLREETPSIRLRGGYPGADFLNVNVSTLRDGEVEIVADRIAAALS